MAGYPITNPNVKRFYDNFLTEANKAGLMANEWKVVIPLLTTPQTSGIEAQPQATLDFYINDVTLPNKKLIEVDKAYRGRKFNAPAGFTFEGDVIFTIDLDSSMAIYTAFANLIGAISPLAQFSGVTGNMGTGYVDDTEGAASVSLSNDAGMVWSPEWEPTATQNNIDIYVGPNGNGGKYTLHGAFPTEIGEIDFANDTPAIATYTVTFTYAYFTYEAQ